jgi:cell division protein FtsW (lipid II flippase)
VRPDRLSRIATAVGTSGAKRTIAILVAVVWRTRSPGSASSLRAWTPALYLISIAALLLLSPMGVSIAGARAWVALRWDSPFSHQSSPNWHSSPPWPPRWPPLRDEVIANDTVAALAIAGLPLAIVLVGNDTGSARSSTESSLW